MTKTLLKLLLATSISLTVSACGSDAKSILGSTGLHTKTASSDGSSFTLSKSDKNSQPSKNNANQDLLILSRTPVKLNILKSSPELTHALETLSNLKDKASQELKVVSITDTQPETKITKSKRGGKAKTTQLHNSRDKTVQLEAKVNSNNINVDISLEAETIKMASLAPNQKITVNKTQFGYMLLADNNPIAGVQK